MKRKLTFREQWLDAYKTHRLSTSMDTEGYYSIGQFSPKFKAALEMTEQPNYFQAYMAGRYELLAKQMKSAKLRGSNARYSYGGNEKWRDKRKGIQIEVKMLAGHWL